MTTPLKFPDLTLYSEAPMPVHLDKSMAYVGGTIRALKTDANTYSLVYSQPNFQGDVRLILPNSSISANIFPIKSATLALTPFSGTYTVLRSDPPLPTPSVQPPTQAATSTYQEPTNQWSWLFYVFVIFIVIIMSYGGYKLWQSVFDDNTVKNTNLIY